MSPLVGIPPLQAPEPKSTTSNIWKLNITPNVWEMTILRDSFIHVWIEQMVSTSPKVFNKHIPKGHHCYTHQMEGAGNTFFHPKWRLYNVPFYWKGVAFTLCRRGFISRCCATVSSPKIAPRGPSQPLSTTSLRLDGKHKRHGNPVVGMDVTGRHYSSLSLYLYGNVQI